MTVLQPHYITAGRYTPRTDRKLFAGIFDTTSGGAIMTGVLPPTNHFEVTHSGLTVSVSPGFAVIADSSSQNTDSPGVYLCTIDANPETLTLPTTAGAYQIYAQVSEAQYTVTTKALTSNVATITTSASHGFLVGETVLVTGVDTTFDGSYVITAKTSTTFSYTKVTTDVVSVADTGYASVPFAIKATAAAGSVPAGSNITLAEVTVASSTIASTNDKRTFVTSRGGVQLWRSASVAGTYTATTPEIGPGRLSYDLSTGDLEYYSHVTATTVPIVLGSTGHHDSQTTNQSNDALHHTIGTGAFNAAAGNHTHTLQSGRFGYNTSTSTAKDTADGTNVTISSTSSGSPNTLIDYAISIPANSTVHAWVLGSASVNVPGTEIVYLGLSSTDDAFAVRNELKANLVLSGATFSTFSVTIPATVVQLMSFTNSTGSAVTKTVSLKAYRTAGGTGYTTTRQTLSVIPFATTSINATT